MTMTRVTKWASGIIAAAMVIFAAVSIDVDIKFGKSCAVKVLSLKDTITVEMEVLCRDDNGEEQ